MKCNICGADVSDNMGFCPNCGAKMEMASTEPKKMSADSTAPVQDIPIEAAPEDFDPEDGTTVLTDGMSGPLTSNDFIKPVREHQPQSPEGKVVTPAPVTGSSILSNDSIAPKKEAAPKSQPQSVQPNGSNQGGKPQGFAAPQGNPQMGGPQQGQKPQGSAPPQGMPPQGMAPQGMPQPGMQPPMMNQGVMPQQMSEQTRPISPWGYAGYWLLYCIPIAGIIIAIVKACSAQNINVKNHAKGFCILFVLFLILSVIFAIIGAMAGIELLDFLDF